MIAPTAEGRWGVEELVEGAWKPVALVGCEDRALAEQDALKLTHGGATARVCDRKYP